MAKLKVTLDKSTSGANKKQLATIQALGLKRVGTSVIHEDNAAIRGMCRKVSHMVSWKEVED